MSTTRRECQALIPFLIFLLFLHILDEEQNVEKKQKEKREVHQAARELISEKVEAMGVWHSLSGPLLEKGGVLKIRRDNLRKYYVYYVIISNVLATSRWEAQTIGPEEDFYFTREGTPQHGDNRV